MWPKLNQDQFIQNQRLHFFSLFDVAVVLVLAAAVVDVVDSAVVVVLTVAVIAAAVVVGVVLVLAVAVASFLSKRLEIYFVVFRVG